MISNHQLDRRSFFRNGSLVLLSAAASQSGWNRLDAAERSKEKVLLFGMITDLHHADKPAAGSRYYRETLDKLAKTAEWFGRESLEFVVELGDLVDSAPEVKTELGYLKRINRDFQALHKNRHYVLGNHCVDTLTKDEFLGEVGQKKSYYSFDADPYHFIVLDACFRADGKPYGRKNSQWNDANLTADQLDWLRDDLKTTTRHTVVFIHQRLDVENDYGVKNAKSIRGILEGSNRVLAVFQGHSHKNDHKVISGIHYCTLVAMIEGSGLENSGSALVTAHPDGTLELKGFRKQKDYDWKK